MLEVASNWPLMSQLIRQQLVLRYRGTFLGYCWTLINPLMMILIIGIVFSSIFKVDFIKFTGFLYAGMIPWNFMNNIVAQSGSAFINNEGLIKKIYIPKIIFPICIVTTLFIDALISFMVLVLLIIIMSGEISWTIIFMPIGFLVLLLFGVGISLIVSVATVFYRDLQYILTILMQGIFYLTPVIYVRDLMPSRLNLIIDFNPLSLLIEVFRSPLSPRVFPSVSTTFLAFVIAVTTLVVGIFIFQQQEKKIVFRL